ncbi:hypothetical protein B0H34DRAFT_152224 [Crassisporium funariophilum]|nr:hypothetical protein B0H34DRAFT_152224 [Crassisporium funariophilum]
MFKSKDVEKTLLNTRNRRRKQGDVPYPIAYTNQMADFDIWDHMFLVSYCKSLTMHQFTEPPLMVLDLGCGSGYWAIEAAKQWPKSTIFGLDTASIQPRLHSIEHLKPLSDRIIWVRANLLDGLPFPPNHFDYVRIAGMGLAVPEDEWQYVVEETRRVMKPGAVLEIIAEDLIFPCSSSLLQGSDSPSPVASPDYFSQLDASTSTTCNSNRHTSGNSPERANLSPTSSTASSIYEAGKYSSRISNFLPSLYTSRHSSTVALAPKSTPSIETLFETEHPQDHTRLTVAWEAMLDKRFLCANVLSVLPLYLTSLSFSVTSHPPLVIPLPPNSGISPPSLKSYCSMGSLRRTDRSFTNTMFDLKRPSSNRSIKADGCSIRSSKSTISPPQTRVWDTMHLTKAVSTITGCKEAIWVEYNKLYSKDALYVLSRTAPRTKDDEEDYSSQPLEHLARIAFEVDWKNWESDMMDRMNMRKSMQTHVGWVQKTSKLDCPYWQTWREDLDGKPGPKMRHGHLVADYDPDDICRSLRAFTACKY